MGKDWTRWVGVSFIGLNVILAPWFLPHNYWALVIGNALLFYNSVKYKDYPTMSLGAIMVVFGLLTICLN